MPQQLSEKSALNRLNVCLSLLARHRKKSFLWKIITGDEKWIYFSNHKQKKSCVDPVQPSTSTAKRDTHVQKTLLCIWWDETGVLYYDLLTPGKTITTCTTE